MSLKPLHLPAAELWLDPEFLPLPAAETLLALLTEVVPWQQQPIRLFGREVLQPRLTAWYGDAGATYSYSGLHLEPLPWLPALAQVRQRVEQATGCRFNSVLLNLYRSDQDSMGYHADDEPELGPEPTIASLTLGATRTFRLKPRPAAFPGAAPLPAPLSIPLTSGSLLVMRGLTQQNWLHALPKTTRPVGPRINLTFRRVSPAKQKQAFAIHQKAPATKP
ncbi:alpha-ketoglutarate-dependent dioxygenase AlkB family protein [Hymenobacter endophyticus]|uniref:Alpha-ketoglutarate-dependent dioxygenase AlkB n=1 Tax=Hymenobacter endophyticus TaxID=3076335 RepID=A0ABU3TH45_9BACT|nr:alpha-ketoglutarate-dependent dioxygenase AlkB [Hymenobacter endophyticus]MDU0370696.1 alpha-ketoglutarate-dependent dioxygenase AlkB [Hymenobacter endophyticus]